MLPHSSVQAIPWTDFQLCVCHLILSGGTGFHPHPCSLVHFIQSQEPCVQAITLRALHVLGGAGLASAAAGSAASQVEAVPAHVQRVLGALPILCPGGAQLVGVLAVLWAVIHHLQETSRGLQCEGVLLVLGPVGAKLVAGHAVSQMNQPAGGRRADCRQCEAQLITVPTPLPGLFPGV